MHSYHEGLPGFSAAQILHDGCGECEARAKEPAGGLGRLDSVNFARAWVRAAEWNRNFVLDMAVAEIPLLSALWAVQLKLESCGFPIGQVPHA